MNRIEQLFQRKQQGILNIYFTAGYPRRDDTTTIIRALSAAGADLIEVGMPYSDPMADGPTIQESGATALKNGMQLPLLFEQIKAVRDQVETPLILMGYFNQVMQFGEARFFRYCREAGVDGLILPDLPLYEYQTQYREAIEAEGLRISFLITPQTTDQRIRQIDALGCGFVYMVSSASVTGTKSAIQPEQIAYFQRIAALQIHTPRLIGFGISNHESFNTACAYANGAIIGSAYIRALAAGHEVLQTTHQFVHAIRGIRVTA